MAGFDLVNQFYRFAAGRNQVEPAPRDHLTRGQAQHAVGNGIAMMMIVKEPGVDVALAERGLYGGKIHGQTTILNKGRVLSESGENGVAQFGANQALTSPEDFSPEGSSVHTV